MKSFAFQKAKKSEVKVKFVFLGAVQRDNAGMGSAGIKFHVSLIFLRNCIAKPFSANCLTYNPPGRKIGAEGPWN